MKNNKLLYNSSLFLLPFSLFIGLGITKIINTAGADSWICVILGSIIGLVLNKIYISLPSSQNRTFFFIANASLLLIGILTISKLISSVYLDRTSNALVMIPLVVLLFYSVTKRRYAIMKTISILLFIYIVLSVFAAASLLPTVELDYFKPVGIEGPKNIILGAFRFAFYSTTPLLVLDDLKSNYNHKVYLASCSFLLIIIILIIGNLGVNLAASYRYPEYMIFKNIAILDFIENIENILFFIWIINIYSLSSHALLNIKDITNNKGVVATLTCEYFIINTLLINNYKTPIIFLKYLDLIVISIAIIFIISKLIKKKKH